MGKKEAKSKQKGTKKIVPKPKVESAQEVILESIPMPVEEKVEVPEETVASIPVEPKITTEIGVTEEVPNPEIKGIEAQDPVLETPKEMHLILLGIKGKCEAVTIETSLDVEGLLIEMCIRAFPGNKRKEIKDIVSPQAVCQKITEVDLANIRKRSLEHHTSTKKSIENWLEMGCNTKYSSTAINALFSLLKEVVRVVAGILGCKAPREMRIEASWPFTRKISEDSKTVTSFALKTSIEKVVSEASMEKVAQ